MHYVTIQIGIITHPHLFHAQVQNLEHTIHSECNFFRTSSRFIDHDSHMKYEYHLISDDKHRNGCRYDSIEIWSPDVPNMNELIESALIGMRSKIVDRVASYSRGR